MRNNTRKLFIALLLFGLVCSIFFTSVTSCSHAFAAHDPVEASASSLAETVHTNFFGDIDDDGSGCSVYLITNLIIDIFSGMVGILAVIGIAIVGVQYITSKGNEQQTTKAKQRLIEIVVGVVAYAVLYSALNFLLPGGKFTDTCSSSSSTDTSQTTD